MRVYFTTNSALQFRHLASEGLVVYLNGAEVYRYNASPGPVQANSEALQNVAADCVLVDLKARLLTGPNTLAVGLLRWNNARLDDLLCGMELQAALSRTSTVPGEGANSNTYRMNIDRSTKPPRLRWSTNYNGMGLQVKTNLDVSLPWITVSNQSNPFVPPADNSAWFYRLIR